MSSKDKHVRRAAPTEFGGVIGTALIILTMPLFILILNLACQQDACSVLSLPRLPPDWATYFDAPVSLAYVAWLALHAVVAVLPMGRVVKGQPLASGHALNYRCNALHSFVFSLVLFVVLLVIGVPVTRVYTKFVPLALAAIVFCIVFSGALYLHSFFVSDSQLATGGNTGYWVYDFFMGRELNPRFGPLDLKFVCELRPGLIGWIVLDASFIVEAYQRHGYVPASLLLVVGFHTCYVVDALWFEEAVLTTMDIVHEGFGFMLVIGGLAWVPFLYSLTARFLLEHPQAWAWPALVAFTALHIIGYTIFRLSNLEKNEFRKDPNNPRLAHLKTMPTASGKKLLISGWWGMCRHPNYMGDLLMALSWSLPCGFQHVLPYFYPVYFLVLLVHRNARDDHNCRLKYGNDWTKYCKLVPYKIFPYIY